MNIGLLLVAEEDDILERILGEHEQIVDCFYALDGTPDNTYSRDLLTSSEKCAGYLTDAEIDGPVLCGMRKVIHDLAVADHGPDHWFLILHGDEVWPSSVEEITAADPSADGFMFRLPFYIPRDEWDYDRSALDQLRWRSEPGWPEFRLFHGAVGVAYRRDQYMNTQPHGLRKIAWAREPILHYPYRSPESQRARATARLDPANYQHASAGRFYWTDEMIADALCPHHSRFFEEELVAAHRG